MSFLGVFFLVAAAFLIVVGAMAIGVMVGRRPISGSCGGLGAREMAGRGLDSSCSVCSNRDTCSESKFASTEASDRACNEVRQ